MHRNTEGLKRSAELRSEATLARATAALQCLEAADHPINFRTVASDARVSTAWLYKQKELRDRIVRSRKGPYLAVPPSSRRDRDRVSKESILATLRMRIKTLENRNRELTELLERACGMIALSRVGSADSTADVKRVR